MLQYRQPRTVDGSQPGLAELQRHGTCCVRRRAPAQNWSKDCRAHRLRCSVRRASSQRPCAENPGVAYSYISGPGTSPSPNHPIFVKPGERLVTFLSITCNLSPAAAEICWAETFWTNIFWAKACRAPPHPGWRNFLSSSGNLVSTCPPPLEERRQSHLRSTSVKNRFCNFLAHLGPSDGSCQFGIFMTVYLHF